MTATSDDSAKEICRRIGHTFKPRDANAPEPEFEDCTFCHSKVEVILKRPVEYKSREGMGLPPLPTDAKTAELKLAPEAFAELKSVAQFVGMWDEALGGYHAQLEASGPGEILFRAYTKRFYQVANHIGPVKVAIDWK
jgi:hypothetical protein